MKPPNQFTSTILKWNSVLNAREHEHGDGIGYVMVRIAWESSK